MMMIRATIPDRTLCRRSNVGTHGTQHPPAASTERRSVADRLVAVRPETVAFGVRLRNFRRCRSPMIRDSDSIAGIDIAVELHILMGQWLHHRAKLADMPAIHADNFRKLLTVEPVHLQTFAIDGPRQLSIRTTASTALRACDAGQFSRRAKEPAVASSGHQWLGRLV